MIESIKLPKELHKEVLDGLRGGGAVEIEGIGRITVSKVQRKGFDVYRQKHQKQAKEYFLPFFKLDKKAKEFIAS